MNDLDVEYNDFVGVYRNALPVGYCEHIMEDFERLDSQGSCNDRQKTEGASRTRKDDTSIHYNPQAFPFLPWEGNSAVYVFHHHLQKCFDHYIDRFAQLKDARIVSKDFKVQRSNPGQGYHIWHCEQGVGGSSTRVLVWIAYLNSLDNKDGGETEFLYQRKRYHPEQGTILLFPANFAYTHRGNSVLGDDSKYIITGWYHYD
jgi:hypothetical protein